MSDEIVSGFRRMDREHNNNPGVAIFGDKWQDCPRLGYPRAYLWSDGAVRSHPEPGLCELKEENSRLLRIIKILERTLEEISRAAIIAHATGKYSLTVEACAESAQEAIKTLRSSP